MTKIGARKIRDGGKVDHQRQAKRIGCMHGNVYGMVICATLSALHPVKNASPAALWHACSANGDSGIVAEGLQLGRQFDSTHRAPTIFVQ